MASKRRIARISHARPSVLEGMARVVDIGGTLNQYDADDLIRMHRAFRARRLAGPSGIEAEAEAIKKVWVDVEGALAMPWAGPPTRHSGPRIRYGAGFEPKSGKYRPRSRSHLKRFSGYRLSPV